MGSEMTRNEFDAQPAAITGTQANIAIYGVVFVIMVSVCRIHEVIPGLAVLKLGKVAFGLAVVLYLISPKRNDLQFISSQQIKYICYLFLLGLLSTLFSFWPGKSLNFMFFNFLSSLVLLFLLTKVTATYADLKKIFWGIAVSLTLLGLKTLSSDAERATSGGGSYDSNDMAFIMVVFLPTFYFHVKNELGIRRWLLVLMMIIAFAVIISTQSRGGFLGLVSILVAIAMKEKVGLFRFAVFCGILALAFSFFAPVGYSERITSIFKPHEDYNMTDGGGRIEIWKRGFQLMLENPVLGVGPFVFEVAESTKHIDESTGTTGKWSVAHNSFVQIGTELGFPGLLLFIMILVTSIRSLRRLQRDLPKDAELYWIINALEVGFYGYIVCGFFLSQAYSAALFLLVGLTVVVSNMVDLKRKSVLELELS